METTISKEKNQASVSVVIPAYNEEKYISDCLKSVLASKTENVVEIIVVNNGSTDKTAEIAASFLGVRVVLESEKGITRARQKGLSEAGGELLACIDADTRVTGKWFEIVNREFASDPELVCVSGPFNYYDLPNYQRVLTSLFQIFFYPLVIRIAGSLVQGGNFVAKKSALLKIGGFDRNIEFYGEDTDIAVRLRRIGRVKYTKKLFIFASARRLQNEGIIRTGVRYGINFIWETVFNRPFSKKHKNIR